MVGDGERDPDDPDYDKKLQVYREALRYARHKRRPGAHGVKRNGFPTCTK